MSYLEYENFRVFIEDRHSEVLRGKNLKTLQGLAWSIPCYKGRRSPRNHSILHRTRSRKIWRGLALT